MWKRQCGMAVAPMWWRSDSDSVEATPWWRVGRLPIGGVVAMCDYGKIICRSLCRSSSLVVVVIDDGSSVTITEEAEVAEVVEVVEVEDVVGWRRWRWWRPQQPRWVQPQRLLYRKQLTLRLQQLQQQQQQQRLHWRVMFETAKRRLD